MNSSWERDFRHRIDVFEAPLLTKREGTAISIKIRVTSGCFHREHSPKAYQIIDAHLHSYSSQDIQFSFREHESGPELLVYIALGTAGITLAKSIIDLITIIIKARSEGIKQGDRPDAPIELIVRGFDDNGKIRDEIVLRFGSQDPVNRELIEKTLQKEISKMLSKLKEKKIHDV